MSRALIVEPYRYGTRSPSLTHTTSLCTTLSRESRPLQYPHHLSWIICDWFAFAQLDASQATTEAADIHALQLMDSEDDGALRRLRCVL